MGAGNMILKLFREIQPEEQSQYLEVRFDMPEAVERLKVSYEVQTYGLQKCVVDLGLIDDKRVRGWSGGARTSFEMGWEKATPGYLPGELTKGSWAVLLGAYKISEGGCLVEITIEFEFEHFRWLKGELHAHTVHSDGAYSLNEVIHMSESAELDFLALTDHNTVSQNFGLPQDTKLVLIPGMELTTNFGHCNFYGVHDPIEDFRVIRMENIHEYISLARERGAKVSLNHPFNKSCGWQWDFNVDHDWVEIWNGPWREENQLTLDWWQGQLASGRRLVAVGGSDFHRDDPYIKHGSPCNWVFSRSKTMKGILEAIDLGHLFLTFSPEGPTIELSNGDYMMGDTVPENHLSEFELSCSQLLEGDQVNFITERGIEWDWVVGTGTDLLQSFQTSIIAEARLFYRVEIWRYFEVVDQKLLVAASNPIYIR
jgi:hypothetical protein